MEREHINLGTLRPVVSIGAPGRKIQPAFLSRTTIGPVTGQGEGGRVDNGDVEPNGEEALRHELAHALASPVRGTAIVADLLAEQLDLGTPDIDVLKELSKQLHSLTEEASSRLAAFAGGSAADG